MSYKIYDDEEYPYFTVVHDGWEVMGFSLHSVQPESREWMCSLINDKVIEQIEKAKKAGYKQCQDDIKAVLQIKG